MSHHKPDPNKSVNLTINGMTVTVPEGTRILEAARKAGVHIPVLCDHPDLCKSPSATRAVCRICVVECDGRGKLLAACANDVWEGVNVVTHNARIINIRKTIVELLLANHPAECLTCIRNKNCELQKLAAEFGIRESSFRPDATVRKPPSVENKALVRDMGKCVKCGRCVEACQEVQTVRAINTSRRGLHYEINTPYGQALANSEANGEAGDSCIFCGHCASVCPVGAIYEYDQSAEAWAAIYDTECKTAVQIAPALGKTLGAEPGLAPGTVSAGKTVTALRHLGFDKVFDAGFFAGEAKKQLFGEIGRRKKNGGALPLIYGCTPGCNKFIKNVYPDLCDHFWEGKSPEQIFAETVRETCTGKTCAVSVSPCIAKKLEAQRSNIDLVLTVREIARMIRLAGIEIVSLPESSFNTPDKTPQTPDGEFKVLTVNGIARARTVMDSVRRGECDAALVEIMSCVGADCQTTSP